MREARKEITVSEGVSPRKLGWRASSDRTALIDEPLEIRVKGRRRGKTLYVCKFRPIKGEWLGQVLTSATAEPGREVFSGAIQADWNIYQNAHREQEQIDRGEFDHPKYGPSDTELLRMHTTDPSIGASMVQFGADYVDLWLRALGDNNAALEKAFRPLEIVDGRFFPEEYIHEDARSHERGRVGGFFFHPNLDYSLAAKFKKATGNMRSFFDFKREEFFLFVEWLKTAYPDKHLLRSNVYHYLAFNGNTDIIDTFPFDRENEWISQYVYANSANDARHTWFSRNWDWPKYTISDREIVLQERDTSVTLDLEPTDNRARPFNIVRRRISFSDTTNALSPTVAWLRTEDPDTQNVRRRFLTRDEIYHHFGPEFKGEVLDDRLGLVAVVVFSPSVNQHTHARLHLQDEGNQARLDGGQRINAAQIPVYYNRPNKRRQIARDRDGVLASIESMY